MKKLIVILVIGLSALLLGSAVQAHSSGHGGTHGSISVGIPIGHNGYATFGVGSPLYHPYYGHSGYRYGHGYGWGRGYKYGHHSYKRGHHKGRHHGRSHDRYGSRHDDRGHGRGNDRGHGDGRDRRRH